MERTVHVTLQDIQRHWKHPNMNQYGRAAKRREFCLKMLPDLFDADLFPNAPAARYFSRQDGLEDPVVRMLVNGNRKSKTGYARYLGCAAFTQDLIDILNDNEPMGLSGETPRKNLFTKLAALAASSDPPLSQRSALFQNIRLEPDMPGGPGEAAYAALRNTCARLWQVGTPQACAYAVMILVLAAWLQWRVADIPWLWDWDEITGYLYTDVPRPAAAEAAFRIPFTDSAYMHEYRAYTFRTTQSRLFEEGTVSITPDSLFGARMELKLRYQAGSDPNHIQTRVYTGTPMLCQNDQCVIADLQDARGAFAHLYFYHRPFLTDMYFRMALLVKKDPEQPTPICQKLVLCRRELPPEQLPYAEGALSTAGDQLIFTEEMLARFCETFRDPVHYPWYPKLEANLLPWLRQTVRDSQVLNCGILRLSALGKFSETEILQIILALKSIRVPGYPRDWRFITCHDTEGLHKLFV